MGESSCRGAAPEKGIDVYVAEKLSQHHFFTKLSPDVVEKKLCEYVRDAGFDEPVVNPEKYEVEFSLGKTVEEKNPDETLLQSEADLDDELDAAMESLDKVALKMRITKQENKEEVKEGEEEDATYAVELIGANEDTFRVAKAVEELQRSTLMFAIDEVEATPVQ